MLLILGADKDKDVALRIGEVMFKKLGYDDFTRTVQKANVEIQLLDDPPLSPRRWRTAAWSKPSRARFLPRPGAAAAIARLGGTDQTCRYHRAPRQRFRPCTDPRRRRPHYAPLKCRGSFRIPAVRVNQVPIRQYIYGELLSHVLGFAFIPAALADDYRGGLQ